MAVPNLDDPLPLATAARYSFPQDATAILPVVFGDYISATHVPTDDEDGGFLPAVCIDRLNNVYLLNDLPNPTTGGIRLYANDTRQADSVFVYSPAVDYESRGHIIATAQLLVDPGSREISWRGQGTRIISTGAMMTNPLDALLLVFSTYGGWTNDNTDYASLMETRRLMNVLGDTINLVFNQARTYREWLETWAQAFHCDLGLDDAGRLTLMLDTSVTTQPTPIITTIDARTDLVGPGTEPLRIRRDASDIVTQITASARRKWTNGKYTTVPTMTYPPGLSLHGVRNRPYELPGVYSTAQFNRWLVGMWLRHGVRADRVTFTTKTLSLISALPGTFLGMISPKRKWPVAQLLKVLSCTPDDEAQTITFECFDTRLPATVAATLPVVVVPEVRTRPRESTPTVDIIPPAAASNLIATGSYRRIVIRWTIPLDSDYSHTEIWTSLTNTRASATHVRNGGNGAVPGSTTEETFDVGDGESFYVWLMTVDRNDNGANGGTGPSGGNWFPASPTAGVLGTAALVPTGGILPAAVTDIYGPDVFFTGVTTGHVSIAHTFFPATTPIGSMLAWGNVNVTVPQLCTVFTTITEGSVLGPILGETLYSNIFNGSASVLLTVPGAHFTPTFGTFYFLTMRVLNQAFVDVFYTVNSSSLLLQHSKR